MAQPTALPVIDISCFRAPDADRDAFLAELRFAAHEVGFSYATGHGVPAPLRDEVMSAARAFFGLPEERRLEIENLNSPQFRGYTRTGAEYTAGSADWREQLDIGPGTGGARCRPGRSRLPASDRSQPMARGATGVEVHRAALAGGGAAGEP